MAGMEQFNKQIDEWLFYFWNHWRLTFSISDEKTLKDLFVKQKRVLKNSQGIYQKHWCWCWKICIVIYPYGSGGMGRTCDTIKQFLTLEITWITRHTKHTELLNWSCECSRLVIRRCLRMWRIMFGSGKGGSLSLSSTESDKSWWNVNIALRKLSSAIIALTNNSENYATEGLWFPMLFKTSQVAIHGRKIRWISIWSVQKDQCVIYKCLSQ